MRLVDRAIYLGGVGIGFLVIGVPLASSNGLHHQHGWFIAGVVVTIVGVLTLIRAFTHYRAEDGRTIRGALVWLLRPFRWVGAFRLRSPVAQRPVLRWPIYRRRLNQGESSWPVLYPVIESATYGPLDDTWDGGVDVTDRINSLVFNGSRDPDHSFRVTNETIMGSEENDPYVGVPKALRIAWFVAPGSTKIEREVPETYVVDLKNPGITEQFPRRK
jgi:hypothetical protein